MLQNNRLPTGLYRGISFLLPSEHQGPRSVYLVYLTPWSSGQPSNTISTRLPRRTQTLDWALPMLH